MQILVLGMHRSGTSAVTRILNLMGASLGEDFQELNKNEANPKGYWERLDLAAFDQELLEACGNDWYYLAGLENRLTHLPDRTWQLRAREVLDKLDQQRPWVAKDPRLSVLLPFWKPLLEQPVAVVAYRDPLEVAESLARRDQLPLDFGVALWFETVRRCLRDLIGMPLVWVGHHRLLADPQATCAKLLSDLKKVGVQGLQMPDRATIREFIDPSLYRARRSVEHHALTPHQEQLWRLQLAEPPVLQETQLPAPDAASRWAEHYGALLRHCGGPFWAEKRRMREILTTDLPALQENARAASDQLAEVRNSLTAVHDSLRNNFALQDSLRNSFNAVHDSFGRQSAEAGEIHQAVGSLQASAAGLHDGLARVLRELAGQQRALDLFAEQFTNERAQRASLEATLARYRAWSGDLARELTAVSAGLPQGIMERLRWQPNQLTDIVARLAQPPEAEES
jgi:hypothetical protein